MPLCRTYKHCRSAALICVFALAACVGINDPKAVAREPTMDLCESYASSGPQPPFGQFDADKTQVIRNELARREAITPDDWQLIDKHEARVGMNECALVASWGEPQKVSHTVTQTGDSAKYEFGKCPWGLCAARQYAYVAKGQVVALQY